MGSGKSEIKSKKKLKVESVLGTLWFYMCNRISNGKKIPVLILNFFFVITTFVIIFCVCNSEYNTHTY